MVIAHSFVSIIRGICIKLYHQKYPKRYGLSDFFVEFITQKKLKLTSIISVFNTDFILPKNY